MAGISPSQGVKSKHMAGRSRSPARRTPRKAASSGGASSKSLFSLPFPTTNKTVQYVSESLARMTVMMTAAMIVYYFSLRFSVISRFICPLATKLYLVPLGLGALKARALTYLAIGWYLVVTYLCLTMAVVVCIPIFAGVPYTCSITSTEKRTFGGVISRLQTAQANNLESLLLLLASVMISWNAGIADDTILEAVTYFLTARKLYVLSFAADCHHGRTFGFLSGVMPCMHLVYLSVAKFL